MATAVLVAAKRYSLPTILFALGFFFQLVLLPRSFPPTHYDVLGVKRNASIEEVTFAYENLTANLFSELDPPITTELIKFRYAFELLTNPLWKRDYDLFGIDEQSHVIKNVTDQYDGEPFSKIELPLINASLLGLFNDATNKLTPEEFISTIRKSKPFLIQVYSAGSPRCAQFISAWKRIESLMEGVAATGMVELGDVQLSSYLAETKFTGQPHYRNGLPALIAFPPNCTNAHCCERYHGEFSIDAIVDWVATDILGLPRILYYSKESLAKFIATSGRHKVKVIYFSETGERAAPFLRQAARDYWDEASFAFVLWREQDISFWWNMFGVDSAPAVIFLKDIYSKPITYNGNFNSSQFQKMMEDYKQNELPQLRSVTSMELGCDAKGYSRAGNDTLTWYCLIVVGRAGRALTQTRETMRRIRDTLMTGDDSDYARNVNALVLARVATALNEDRLTFTWLDGDVQQKYCQFYIPPEYHSKCCGSQSYEDDIDVPQIFIIRYLRNSTEGKVKNDKWKNYLNQQLAMDSNVASQLMARYPGSVDGGEIIQWISHIVERGDTREYPSFTFRNPELVPEDTDSKRSQGILSFRKAIKDKLKKILFYMNDLTADPRIGPSLLLGACVLFGTIWLQSNRRKSTIPSNTTNSSSTTNRDERTRSSRARNKNQRATSSSHDIPPSITDEEPKDAYQLLSTDSDSE
ncbi:hypothetical protein Cni_G06286 [Canna indica]|uniref:J domain-containing protein n=1 Tax=Canna indica TaxID=4628 RepID=A0AAQ3JWR3_9LILI|nr:hypothetical protein Cni_G06286 [Canna indica]